MENNFNYKQLNINKKLVIIIISLIVVLCISIFVYFKFIYSNTHIDKQNLIANNSFNNSSNISNKIESEIMNANEITNTSDSENEILKYDENYSFLMPIDSVFTVENEGTYVLGDIAKGSIYLNDEIQIIGLNGEIKTSVVVAITSFRKNLESATVGDRVSLGLKDIQKEEIEIWSNCVKTN